MTKDDDSDQEVEEVCFFFLNFLQAGVFQKAPETVISQRK
jgi:hypothetical protein